MGETGKRAAKAKGPRSGLRCSVLTQRRRARVAAGSLGHRNYSCDPSLPKRSAELGSAGEQHGRRRELELELIQFSMTEASAAG